MQIKDHQFSINEKTVMPKCPISRAGLAIQFRSTYFVYSISLMSPLQFKSVLYQPLLLFTCPSSSVTKHYNLVPV